MSDSMVERVALTLYDQDARRSPVRWVAFHNAKLSKQSDYRNRARAVIEAMREPTPAMIAAMAPQEWWMRHPEANPEIVERWCLEHREAAMSRRHAGIDAALAPASDSTAGDGNG